MIKLPSKICPEKSVLDALEKWQKEIDILPTFKERSDKAKDSFPKRNKKKNSVFDQIKEKLTEMCCGARRCAYCEDSVGDEVEHIHPKDLFPEQCFSWENYVYACGPCNGPKNNKFAVFRKDNGNFEIITPPKKAVAKEPPKGEDAVINPRKEDPLDFCMLDLQNTFRFVVISAEKTKEYYKADYTYNDVLRLNEREYLRIARKNAYGNYKARLYQYNNEKIKGAPQNKLNEMIKGIQTEAHPTVWKEMQRYHIKGHLSKIDADLDKMFIQSPEALNW